MNRRQVLVSGLTGYAGILAGCSIPFERNRPEGSKPQLEVFVANTLEEQIQVTVAAFRGSSELFTHEYTLTPREGDESKSFVGTPTEIRVSIEGGRIVTRGYSLPPSCESPGVNVTIEPDEILVTNDCPPS
jgi:hypothetical protein